MTGAQDRLHRVPAPGEWSPGMVLVHMADNEIVYSFGLRLLLTSGRAQLPAFDAGAWVERFADLDADAKQSIARWRPLREANLRVLETLEEEEWLLAGWQAGDQQEVSVRRLTEQLAGHDRRHLDQLRAALAPGG